MANDLKRFVGEYDEQTTRPVATDFLLLEKGLGDYRKVSTRLVGGGGSGATVTVGHAESGADYLTSDYDTDDAAVQAAVNSISSFNPDAVSSGGVVEILDGEYTFMDRVVIISQNLTVRGQSLATYIKLGDYANTELFVVGNGGANYAEVDSPSGAHCRTPFMTFGTKYPCNNISFETLHLDGNKLEQEDDHTTWVAIQYSVSATRNLIRYRSDAQTSYGGHMWDIYATDCIQNGLSSESHAFLSISECFVERCDVFGIWFENGDATNISDCFTRENGAGIKVLSAGRFSIRGCISKGDNDAAFALQSVGEASIIGNTAYRPGWHGATFTVADGFNLSSVRNSSFSGNTVFGAYGHGVRLNGCDNNIFTGFTFRRNGQGTTNTYADVYFTDDGGGSASNDNQFIGFTFNNESPSYYSERVKHNIWMDDPGTHTGNIFQNFKFDITNPPITSYLHNVQATTAIKANNAVKNSINMNPDTPYYHGDKTGAVTVSRILGCDHKITATGNITLTIPNGLVIDDVLTLTVTQDATGSRTISKPANVKLVGGAFSPTATAAAIDTWTLRWDGTSWNEISRSLNVS